MFIKSSSEGLAESLLRAQDHWYQERAREPKSPQPSKPPTAFTIAISREAGIDGTSIARKVAEELGWALYDRELLQKIADEKGLRVKLLESADEKHGSWFHDALAQFFSVPALSSVAYRHYLAEALFSLAALGECVIVGRGAAQVLPPETTLRVRLICPKIERITAISRELAIPEAEAGRWLERTDRERTSFVRDHFRKDPADPCIYDLILNTSRFSVNEAAGLIVQRLRQLQNRRVATAR